MWMTLYSKYLINFLIEFHNPLFFLVFHLYVHCLVFCSYGDLFCLCGSILYVNQTDDLYFHALYFLCSYHHFQSCEALLIMMTNAKVAAASDIFYMVKFYHLCLFHLLYILVLNLYPFQEFEGHILFFNFTQFSVSFINDNLL